MSSRVAAMGNSSAASHSEGAVPLHSYAKYSYTNKYVHTELHSASGPWRNWHRQPTSRAPEKSFEMRQPRRHNQQDCAEPHHFDPFVSAAEIWVRYRQHQAHKLVSPAP
ncbi:uncharacterized protein B0I36DRAFT_10790 [Microdochium trichocladiopsis]|uniref:Uncharacterized protein n=1 Tax=Microdochium trichocladiopsis TaxID=1682393 RepID=A0A9P9BW58_9PEZI|nr:uncharacterized protein B0I36DRAFT_10790 [Microdochium trichocladiopsis]KAH7040467.1 hypothetical protein B0I36DRAFT_10790 [Microdochium trichocladiopsis]